LTGAVNNAAQSNFLANLLSPNGANASSSGGYNLNSPNGILNYFQTGSNT
jgi:hypothetical protein